jgi:hypothetical protein
MAAWRQKAAPWRISIGGRKIPRAFSGLAAATAAGRRRRRAYLLAPRAGGVK